MNYQIRRKLDNIRLCARFARPIAHSTLVVTDKALLQIQLKALLDTGLVGMLWQGKGQHGEVAVGDWLSLAKETFNHGAGLATEQLVYNGLIPLHKVDPVSPCSRNISVVHNNLPWGGIWLGSSVDLLLEPVQHGAEELLRVLLSHLGKTLVVSSNNRLEIYWTDGLELGRPKLLQYLVQNYLINW